ncbi:nuclear transport factor 2 family protein [Candidatus Halocynthiibacter alkanivorans]|uniref:nuclear transport factor 2 family protein n=1 Tax=Candidatus Halocynthiibacter alkanivorans TaxID=2267619 RepID=UPI00109D0496|nr:nuclear transport factor 2 family protein [Candidatus Halocynthiibacter alkanivorans]
MKITSKSMTEHTPLIAELYSAVDAMDANKVASFLVDNVTFQLGNFDKLTNRKDVEEANASFFKTIKAMRHTISGIWASGSTAFCDGLVHYTRKDLSEHEVPFATRLELQDGKITDYRVYVDISGL